MKALLLKGVRELTLEEVPIPEISDTEVLVEVKYCGICGTDIGAYKSPVYFPAGTFMGHEFSGLSPELVTRCKAGDKGTEW